ncbi:MAG: hypothetical protein M1837_003382 [Sclerophora amabilis]|nr:MAG: hypothetical protein M1837_003382 [Sclerophora amabilis]
MSSAANWGAVVTIKPLEGNDNNDLYEVNQLDLQSPFPPGDKNDLPRASIDWDFGPLGVKATIDYDKREFGVSVTVVGIGIGNFWASFDTGISLTVNLLVANGSLRFYIKDGKQLWVHIDLKLTFDGSWDTDQQIYPL